MRSSVFDSSLFVIKEVNNKDEIAKVLAVEKRIFEENDFVSMSEYEKYLPQSIFFGAFNAEAECVGMIRMIKGGPILPPFLNHGLEIDIDRDLWIEKASFDELWELATMAVVPGVRNTPVFLSLVGTCFRYVFRAGVKYCGAIMDPARAEAQNRAFELCFKQVGPLQYYMGEPMLNAPYVLSMDEQVSIAASRNPDYCEWLVNGTEADLRRRPHKKIHADVIDLRTARVSETATVLSESKQKLPRPATAG